MTKLLLLVSSILGSLFFTPVGQRLRSYEDVRWIREGIVVTSNVPSPKGFEPTKTIDGDESFDSRWIGADNPDPNFQYELKYDLTFVRTIYKIEMVTNGPYPAQKIGNVRQYDVLISLDDSNYVKLYSSPILPDITYVDSYMFVPTQARFVKVLINSKYGIHPEIREFKIFTTSPIRYERRLVKKVTASSSAPGSDPKDTVNPFSRKGWASKEGASPPVSLTYELVDLLRIEGVRVRTGGPKNTVKQYDVFLSVDGRNFSKVASSKELPDSPILDEISFPPTWARFVRISINQWHGSFAEIKGVEFIRSVSTGMSGHPVLLFYDDCGNEGKQPHLKRGRSFSEWKDIDPQTPQPEKDVAYDDDKVVLRYTGLNPSEFYGVEVTYIQDKGDLRRQALYAGQYEVHGDLLLPNYKAKRYSFDIPPMAYSNGTLTLTFKKLTGPNAVVSEVRLYRLLQPSLLRKSSPSYPWRAFRAASPLSIDGDLSEWALASPIKLGNSSLWIQWDDSSLYLAGEIGVRDGPVDVLLDPKADSFGFYFEQDDIHLSIIPPEGKGSAAMVKLIHHFGDPFPENMVLGKEIIECASKVKENGEWSFELKIPKDKLLGGIPLSQGGRIRANFALRTDGRLVSWAGDTSEYESYAPIFFNPVSLYGPTKATISLEGMDGKPLSKVVAGMSFRVLIQDADRNLEPEKEETIQIRVRSKPTGDFEIVSLKETGPDTGLFSGTVLTEFGTSPIIGDYALQVRGGDEVVVEYEDRTFIIGEEERLVSASCITATGSDGKLSIFVMKDGKLSEASSIRCGDEITIELLDPDISGRGEIKVKVAGTFLGSVQDLILSEEKDSPGRFRGVLKTTYSERPTYEGPLGITGGERVLVTYMDEIRTDGETNVPVIARATVEVGTTGALSIQEVGGKEISTFRAGDVLRIALRDPDISRLPSINVSIEGGMTKDKEVIELKRSHQDESTFTGEVRTEYGTASIMGDGVLTVQGNEEVMAIYLDAIQETGRTNVQVIAKAKVEVGTTAEILLLERDLSTELSAIKARDSIWILVRDPDCDKNPDSLDSVTVAVAARRGSLGSIKLMETGKHSGIFVGELSTRFWTDPIGLGSVPIRGGDEIVVTYVDEIQADGKTNVHLKASTKVMTGHTGEISLLKDLKGEEVKIVSPGDVVWVRLFDPDISDPDALDSVIVRVLGDTGDSVELRLLETGADTGTFMGVLKTSYSYEADPSNSLLELRGEGKVKLVYIDDLTSDGARDIEISKEYDVLKFLRALRATTKVLVDGNLEDWPTGSFAELKEEGRVLGRIYVQWDANNIYIGADITTGSPPSVRDPRNPSYGSDSILIFIDTEPVELPPYLSGSVGPGSHLFFLLPLGGGKDGKKATSIQWHRPGDSIMETIFNHRDIEVGAKPKDDGYTLEARIPRGKVIREFSPYRKSWGFNCHLFTSSGGRTEWARGPRGSERIDPARFGRLDMVDSISEIPQDLRRKGDLEKLDLEKLKEEAKAYGVEVEAGKVEEEIRHYGIFWKDGSFSEGLYKALRADKSLGWEDIEEWEGKRLILSEMGRKVVEGISIPESEVRSLFLKEFQRIKAQAFIIPDPERAEGKRRTMRLNGILIPAYRFPKVVVRNEDAEEFYTRNMELFRVLERRRVRAIPATDEGTAKGIASSLIKDRSTLFKLTRSLGTGSWFENGCDLGYVGKGDLIPELQLLIFSAKEGDIIGPLKIGDRFWVLLVEEIRPSFLKGFDEVRDRIHEMLREEKEEAERRSLLSKAREWLEEGKDPKDVAKGLKWEVWDPGRPIERAFGLDQLLEGAKPGDLIGPVDLPMGTVLAKVVEVSHPRNPQERSPSYEKAMATISRLKNGEEIREPGIIPIEMGPMTRAEMRDRWRIRDEDIEAIFSASPGDVVGPFPLKRGYMVLTIVERNDEEEKYRERASSILSELISRKKEEILAEKKRRAMVKAR